MSTQTIGKKSKELLLITLLLNIAAFGWYGFLFAEIKAKNERISDLVNRIEAESAAGDTLSSQKMLAVETSALREKLFGYSVAREGAVSFIELLEATGNEVGAHIIIESVSTKERADFPQVEDLRFALAVTGTWPAVVRLLGLFELLPYEMRVEQAVLSKVGSSGGDPWRADLSLTVLKEK